MRAELNLVNRRINQTNLEVRKLTIDIINSQNTAENQKEISASLLRNFAEISDQSLVEILLAHDALSDFSLAVANLEFIEVRLIQSIRELKALKKELEVEREDKERKQEERGLLKVELQDRNAILKNTYSFSSNNSR